MDVLYAVACKFEVEDDQGKHEVKHRYSVTAPNAVEALAPAVEAAAETGATIINLDVYRRWR